MNNKGFTLIELLSVIIIISILVIFVVPKLANSTKGSSDKADKVTENLIFEATNFYIVDNSDEYRGKSGAIYCIELSKLVDSEYLKPSLKLSDNEDLVETKSVKVSYKKDYKYELVDNNKCIENFPALEPNLHNNSLIPVIYKNSNWIVVDKTSSEWYNYENQEWANAVILKKGIVKNIGDVVNVASDVQGMFVWVPRYEYKIEGIYGKQINGIPGTQALPGEIKINFIGKFKTEPDDGYIIHPAFKFGSEVLSGIWVGKFETTGVAENPTVLPNVTSLRNQNVSTQFATAQVFNQYLSNGDSHMAKNSEWSAVSYLSQSIYGKYGNPNYTGEEKEVAINNCSNYITGIGGDSVKASESQTTCTTNTYETVKGQAASTTGNITGVYDMSGGSYENVMGYLQTSNTIWGALSGFTSAPDQRYFDVYTDKIVATACNSEICYGHALSETENWYGDSSVFVSSDGPWFGRGSSYQRSSLSGVFAFHAGAGAGYIGTSFRIIIS